MLTGTHIVEAYDALAALLATALTPLNVKVRALTGGDFQAETARLIVSPPAALVAFRGEQLAARSSYSDVYHSTQQFSIICGARSLRGTQQERAGALEILTAAANAVAGAKLNLPSSNQKALVTLRSVALGQLDQDGTWYTLEVEVFSVAQYGANAA